MSPRIAVIGGGITGLSACYHLERLGFSQIVLFESSKRLGGKIQTESSEGWQVELGPDSIFTRQPEVLELIQDLGISDQVIEPKVKGFSIYLDGALRQIPPGISNVAKIDPVALASFPYLSDAAKKKAAQEIEVARNVASDESVAAFFSRRFGREYAKRIAEPLFAGTHGGNAEELSMEALYPEFRRDESIYGSLAAASRAKEKKSVGVLGPRFISFKSGSEQLTKSLTKNLSTTHVIHQQVQGVTPQRREVRVDGSPFDAAAICLPANAAASLLGDSVTDAAQLLKEIKFQSSIIVTFEYEQSGEQLGLVGTGFLVPEGAGPKLRGATWSSNKWEGRAPDRKSLIRVFLPWQSSTAGEVAEVARRGLQELAGINVEPISRRVQSWPDGLPQYRVGHKDLVKQIESILEKTGPIFVAGQSFGGAGIPDCIRQGKEVAQKIGAAFWAPVRA